MNPYTNLPPGCLPSDTDGPKPDSMPTERGLDEEARPLWLAKHGQWMKERLAQFGTIGPI